VSKSEEIDRAQPDYPSFREDALEYPSDRLTLRQLRSLCPDPDLLARSIKEVRILEANFAVAAYGEACVQSEGETPWKVSEMFPAETQSAFRDLKAFYVRAGLATGDHGAELLIRDIERQAKNQIAVRPR
jgi:hypothetical protein